MNGQELHQLEDPLFASLESWQRENPVRHRINSSDLEKENGNFVTVCGRFRRKRQSKRKDLEIEEDDFQLQDDRGVIFVRPTKFISRVDVSKVGFVRITKE